MASTQAPTSHMPASFWSCRKQKHGVTYIYSDSRCQLMHIFTCPWCMLSSWTDCLLYSGTPAEQVLLCKWHCHHIFTLFLFLLLQLKVRAERFIRPKSTWALSLLLTLIRRTVNLVMDHEFHQKPAGCSLVPLTSLCNVFPKEGEPTKYF